MGGGELSFVAATGDDKVFSFFFSRGEDGIFRGLGIYVS